MKKHWIVAALLGLILLPILAVQACGPDFEPDVFVSRLHPGQPKEFAAGQLGVLLPTYPRMDLIVAFRYLNGGVLDAPAQTAYVPTYSMAEEDSMQPAIDNGRQAPDALAAWNTETVATHRNIEFKGTSYTYQSSYLNCNEDAFRNAATTLQSRAQSWGAQSAFLADWIHGQGAVFANCSGATPVMPAAVPADAPALLKADRAYQTAAALFYAGKFDEARDVFSAIRKDSASPWQGIAGYLEARCLIRQAFLSNLAAGQDTLSNFDPLRMKEAADLLQALLKEKHDGISQAAIENELNLVRIRIEPLNRVHELATLLAGPAADSNYKQNLMDIIWFLDQKLDSTALRQPLFSETSPTDYSDTYKQTSELRATAPLVDWALTFQSPSAEAKERAITAWEKTPTPYWLVAALTKANGQDSVAPRLIAAATKVNRSSPAWETATYQRARLLIEAGRTDGARTLLDGALPMLRAAQRDSSVNFYQSLRLSAAMSLDQFLQYAPQKILLRSSEASWASTECLDVMKDPKRKYDCVRSVDANQFSDTAARFLNAQAPLSVLVEAAGSKALPPQMQKAVAMMAWTRSILLKDDAAASKLLPLLPMLLQKQAGSDTGIRAIITLVRNPGLRPFLEAGVQSSYSYDFVESFRDNWWCTGFQAGWASSRQLFPSEPVAFLTAAQRQDAARQLDELKARGDAKLYLGNQVLSYVQAHADDPSAAESLYLVLRMIRYGCDSQIYATGGKPTEESRKIGALKANAARLMRQHYASSYWTKKAAPFVG